MTRSNKQNKAQMFTSSVKSLRVIYCHVKCTDNATIRVQNKNGHTDWHAGSLVHVPTGCWFVGGDDLSGALHDL